MQPRLEGRRILVVDNDVDSAELLAELLRLSGAEVALAHDGARALELAGTFAPAVALVDIELSGMDGFELAAALRTRPAPPRLIALTGHGDAEARARSERAGFVAHLVKPVETGALLDAITAPG